jgi:hypothetical protein
MSTIGNLVESLVSKHSTNTKVLNEIRFRPSENNKNFEKQILRLTSKKDHLKKSKKDKSIEIELLESKISNLILELKNSETTKPELYLYQATPLYQKILTLRERKSLSNTTFRLIKIYLLALITTKIEDTPTVEFYRESPVEKLDLIPAKSTYEVMTVIEEVRVEDQFYNLHLLEQNNLTLVSKKKTKKPKTYRTSQNSISLKVNQKALEKNLVR